MSSPRLAWSSVYTPSHAVRDSAAGPCARSRPNREASAARTRMAATFFIFTWSWPSGRWNIRAAARSFPRRWQRVSNVLTGVRPAADCNYDVLLAMHHVGHRRTGCGGGLCPAPTFLPVGLSEERNVAPVGLIRVG